MFTMLAGATVALVVLIERRRRHFNGNPVGARSTSRNYSPFGSYLPFAVLIALGFIVDRIPW
jgi:Flp pilus assembly protein protease CpaA